jgi:uncharacterized protein (DUF488 family)
MSSALERVLTIGIYRFDASAFADALKEAGADVVVDIRARRGIRGSRYSWGNSQRLQALLRSAAVAYQYLPDFAPTDSIRSLQREVDGALAVAKRERVALAPAFSEEYRRSILRDDACERFVASLHLGSRRPALLCVEALPGACHRSLLAAELHVRLGIPVEHLTP